MQKESDFIQGMEDYKQKTDLFPHPSADEVQGETSRFTRAANTFIAKSKKITEATKRSTLVFRENTKD